MKSINRLFPSAMKGLFIAASFGAIQATQAADFDWNAIYGGTYDWQYHSHWAPDSLLPINVGVLPNTAGDAAFLNAGISGNQNILLNGAVTLGALNLGDSSDRYSITIAPGTGGALTLGGATPTINKTGVRTDVISSGIALGAGSVINVTEGALALNGVLTGTSGFTKTGDGMLILRGASTYTGVTNVNGGIVLLAPLVNDGTILGSTAAGNNTIIGNGATVALGPDVLGSGGIGGTSDNFVLNGNGFRNLGALRYMMGANNASIGSITVNSSSRVHSDVGTGTLGMGALTLGTNNMSFTGYGGQHDLSGVVSGTGTITKLGANNLHFAAANNTFTGTIDATLGILYAGNNTNTMGSVSIVNARNATFQIIMANNAATTNTRMNDAAAINLYGSRLYLEISGTNGAFNSAETVGAVTMHAGANALDVEQANSGQFNQLTLTSLTRNEGATVNFQGTELGKNIRGQIISTAAVTLDDGILGGWATYGAVGNFMKYDGTLGYTELLAADYLSDTLVGVAATSNLRLTSGNLTLGAGTTTVNSVNFQSDTLRTLSGPVGGTLVVDSGGVLMTRSSSGTSQIHVLGSLANNDSITAGPGAGNTYELFFHTINAWGNVAGKIVDNGGNAVDLVKAGSGTLLLSNDNTYTGTTYINEGVLRDSIFDGRTGLGGGNLVIAGGINNQSVFETATDFTRALGSGAGQVRITGGTGSGFSAFGGPVDINFGNAGAEVLWGSADFNPSIFTLNGGNATHATTLVNSLNLGGELRAIRLDGNASGGNPAAIGVIKGDIKNGGIVKRGGGVLVINNAKSYEGSTQIQDGVVWLRDSGTLGANVAGNDILIASGGNLRVENPNLIGDQQRIILNNNSVDVPAAVAFGTGYGDGSGINFSSFATANGAPQTGGNDIFIANDQGTQARRVALQISGGEWNNDVVSRAKAAAPNVEIWLGATTANGVYSGTSLVTTGSSAAGQAYRLGSGGGTLTIANANVLDDGANDYNLIVGAIDGTARTNIGGTVYIPKAQNYSGTTVLGNSGILIVGGNSSLGTSVNPITMAGGELRVNPQNGLYGGVDSQYAARSLSLTAGATLRTATLGGSGFMVVEMKDLNYTNADGSGNRVFAFIGENTTELRLTGNLTPTYNVAGNIYLDIGADNDFRAGRGIMTIQGIIADGGTGLQNLRKRNGGVLILQGDNAYDGETFIEQGRLVLSHLGAAGTAGSNINLANNSSRRADLEVRMNGTGNTPEQIVFNNSISTSGGDDSSTRVITVGPIGVGSENKEVLFNSLNIAHSGAAVTGASNSASIFFDGFNGYRTTITGGVTLGRDIDLRTRGALTTFNGVVSGAFGIRKYEQGTLWLNGANTYTGATALYNGYTVAGNNLAFGNATTDITFNGASFAQLLLSGNNRTISRNIVNNATGSVQTLGGIDAGAKTFSGLVNVTAKGVNLSAENGGNVTFSGALSGSGAIIKVGDGTVILDPTSGTGNAATSAITVADGTLIGKAQATSGSPFGTNNSFTVNNGTLQLDGRLTATNTTTTGSLTMGGGGGRVVINDNAGDGFNTQLTLGSLANPVGAATAVFAAANGTLGGESRIVVTGASPSANGIIGTWAVAKNGTSAASYAANTANGIAAHNFGANTGNIDTVTGPSQVFDASGTGGTLTANRSVYAVRTDTNLNLGGFRLSVGDATTTGRGGLLLNNGADISNGDLHFANNQLSVYVDDGGVSTISAVLTNLRSNANNTLSTGNVASTAVFTKFGLGTLELSGANTFQGNVQVNEGILSLTAANVLPMFSNLNARTGSIVTIQPNGRVNLNGNNQEFGNLVGVNPGSVFQTGGIIDLGSATLTVGREGSTQTFAGQIIGGAGSKISKVGGGTLSLTNINGSQANSLETLEINQGTVLTRADDNSWATPVGLAYSLPSTTNVILRGGQWNLRSVGDSTSNAQRIAVGNNLTVSGGDSVLSVDRPEGSGSNKLLTMGNLTLDVQRFLVTAGNTYIPRFDGTTTLLNHARIQTDSQLVLGGAITGNYSINKVGASDLAIAANNSAWDGGLIISSGTLFFGSRGTDDIRYAGTTFVPSSTANAGTGDIVVNQGMFLNGATAVRLNATSNVLTAQGQRVQLFGSQTAGTVRVDIGQDAAVDGYGLRSTTNGSLSLGIGDGGLYTSELDQSRMGNGKWSMSAFQATTFYTADRLGAGNDNVYRFGGTNAGILALTATNVLTGSASVEFGRNQLAFGSVQQNVTSQIRTYGNQDYTGKTIIHRGADFGSIGNDFVFHGDLATSGIEVYGRVQARGDGRFTNDDGSQRTSVTLRPGGALRLDYNMDVNDQFIISRLNNSNLGLEEHENKWGDDTALVLDGAQLALINSSGRVNQEEVGEITVKGGAGIYLERNGGNGQAILSTDYGIVRSGQATLAIRENADELGTTGLQGMKMFINNPTWVANNTTNGILPVWMINATRQTFLGYGPTGIVNAPWTHTISTAATLNTLTNTSVARYTGGTGTVSGTVNTYALRVDASTAAATMTGGQINIHSGGLIVDHSSTTAVNFDTTAVYFGDGTTAKEGIIYVDENSLRFGGTVTANNLTKNGPGNVHLAGQNNAITGNVQINGGGLILDWAGTGAGPAGSATITLHADHLNNNNGSQMPVLTLRTDSQSRNFNNSVIIAENVPLARIAFDRFSGSSAGTIGIQSLNILGTNGSAGTMLQFESANSNLLSVLGTTTIGGTSPVGMRVNGQTVTLTGAVTSAVGITKTGDGALRFDAANTGFTGGFTLNRGEWRLNGTNVNTGGTGDVTLNFGNVRLANNGVMTHFNAANQDIFVNGNVTFIADRNGGSNGAHTTIGTNNGTNTIVTNNNAYLRFNATGFGDDFYIESKLIVNDTLTLQTDSADVFLRDTISGQGKVVKNGNWVLHFDNNVANNDWTGGMDILHGFVRVTPGAGNVNANLGTGPITVGPTGAISLNSTTNIAGGAITRFQSGKTTSSVLAVSSQAALGAINTLLPTANNTTRSGLGGILALDSLTVSTALNMATIQDGYWSLGALQDRSSTYSATSLGVGAGNVYRIGGGGGALTVNPTTEADVLEGTAQVMIGRPDSYFAAGYNATHVIFGANLNNSYSGGTTVTRARDFGGGWYQTALEVQGGNPSETNYRTPLGTGQVDNYGSIRFSGAGGTLVNGAGENYVNIVMHTGSRITFDNRTASFDAGGEGRYDDSGVLTLDGANVLVRGTSNVNTADTNREDIGELMVKRGSSVRLQREGTGYAGLGMNTLTRGLHGTLVINHNSGTLGANTAAGGVNNTEAFFIRNGGTIPMTNGMVDPWIISRQSDQFVKYDNTNGLQLITQGTAPANYLNVAAATTILDGTLGAAVTNGTAILDLNAASANQTLGANLDVHALRYFRDINTSADGQFNRITIRSGGLLLAGNNAGTIYADLYFGAAGNGTGEALIYSGGNIAQINGRIYANQVTKFGRNGLYIRGDQSQFTGNWVVNEGVLRFLAPGANGSSSSQVILNGSTIGDNADRIDGGDSHVLTDLQYVYNSGSVDLFDWGGGKITAYDHNRIYASMGSVNDRNQKIADIDLRTTATTPGGLQSGLMRFQIDNSRNTLYTGMVTLFDHYMIYVDSGSFGAGSTSGVQFGGLNNSGLFDLIKTGDSILALGDNSTTFTGNRFTFVDEGTIRALHNGAFGAAGNTAVINQGGGLEIAVANFQPLATLDQRSGSIERWAVNGARTGTVNLASGVHLQIGANQTGTQTINLNGGSIMGYQPLDYDQVAIIQTLGSGITVNLQDNSYLGQPFPVGGNAVNYDMGKLNTTTNLNPNDPGLRGSYLQIDGNITGNFDLTKVGQDIILLNGQNTYRNTIIESGILQIGRANGLSVTGTLTTKMTGMFDLNGFNQTVAGLGGTGGSVNNGAFAINTLTVNQAGNTTYAGVVDGNVRLVKQGAGALTLTGNNAHRGGTVIEGGTLSISKDASLGQIPVSDDSSEWVEINGGALETTASFTMAANRNVFLWNNVDNIIRTAAATSLTIDSAMFGSGGFAKEGAGTLALSGSNKEYLGNTVVRAGVLQGTAANTLAAFSRHVVDGGTLNVANFNQRIGSLHSGVGIGTVDLGANTLQVGLDNTTDASFAGQINGTSAALLQKVGYGDQTIAGSNAGQAWGTLISNGRLSVASGATVGSGAINIATTSATAIFDETALQLSGITTLANNVNVGTQNGRGTTFIEKTGAGTAGLTGTVTLGRDTFLAVGTGGTLESSGAGTITGPGRVTVIDGGTVSLVNANTYGGISNASNSAGIDGGTVIRNGTVLVGNSNALGAGTVELGDTTTALAAVKGTTTSSLLGGAGVTFDPAGDTGKGSISGVSTTIDGVAYVAGDRILVKDEEGFAEANGIYVVSSVNGSQMTLVRAGDFNATAPNLAGYANQPEISYGVQVDVASGSNAGKSFFMSQSTISVLNSAADPIRFREDDKTPDIALLQNTSGLVTANKIDVNATTVGGTTSIGGSSAFTTGNGKYTSDVRLQDLNTAAAENKEVRLVSYSNGSGTAPGVEFSGVISEANTAQDKLKIVKAGTGVVVMSAANDYHGGTDVLEGVLQVGLSDVGTTGPGGTVVFTGATLAGSGLVKGVDRNTVHTISGMLKPGDSAGEGFGSLEVLGTLTMGTGSQIVFQLGTGQTGNYTTLGLLTDLTVGSVNYSGALVTITNNWKSTLPPNITPTEIGYDYLNVEGSLILNDQGQVVVTGVASNLQLGDVFNLLDVDPLGTYTAGLFDTGGTTRGGGLIGDLSLPTLNAGLLWDTSRFKTDGLLVVVAGVPEPGRAMLVLMGVAMLFMRRRRKA